jgi:Nitrile hydratase, alpha chain
MPDPNEIKKQTQINSGNVTPEEAAAEMSKAEKWSPHVSDGLDALEAAAAKLEFKKWSQVVARAWSDGKFKEGLLQDPPTALKEFGIDVPAGVEIRVVENTDKVRYVTLPAKPAVDVTELGEKELDAVAAGFTCCIYCEAPVPKWADTWIYTA